MSDFAAVSITRTNPGDGESKIKFDLEWQGNRLKLEMDLAEFAKAVTGICATPALVTRWRPKTIS